MRNVNRWAVIAGMLLLVAAVGAIAWNAGFNQGIEESGRIVTTVSQPHYGWDHHPWGFGFRFFFFPLFFIVFWVLVVRAVAGRRGLRHGYHCCHHEPSGGGTAQP